MLPDFPKVRDYGNNILERWFRRRIFMRMGVLQEIGVKVLEEGNKVFLIRVDGSRETVPMKSNGSEFRLDYEDFKENGLDSVLRALDKTASDIADKQIKFFFERLNEICEESGQTADAKGASISYDLVFEQLEKVDFDFNDAGEPLLPSIISSPKILEQLSKQEMTNELQQKFERIIEKKRSEWRDRESDRKLVS